jgi:uncharacterized protein YdhG (YjbR/CyaY superfamily)
MAAPVRTVEDYIAACPTDSRALLTQLRAVILAAAPGTAEKISYGMPTVTLDGRNVVHYAAWKHHVGLYPVPALDDELEREAAPYRTAKSTVRFALDQPVPRELVERLVAVLLQRRRAG